MHPGYFPADRGRRTDRRNRPESVGLHDLALMAFGIGLICWIVLGPCCSSDCSSGPCCRLRWSPCWPSSWPRPPWRATRGRAEPETDPVQYGLGAYTLLMALVQLRLIPEYRKAPFGASYWAFAFSYAAAATYAMHWLHLSPFPGGPVTAWVLALCSSAALCCSSRCVPWPRSGPAPTSRGGSRSQIRPVRGHATGRNIHKPRVGARIRSVLSCTPSHHEVRWCWSASSGPSPGEPGARVGLAGWLDPSQRAGDGGGRGPRMAQSYSAISCAAVLLTS